MTHQEILEAIEKMTVLELAELIKAIEEKFGVSAAAPVAVAAAAGPAAAAPAQRAGRHRRLHPGSSGPAMNGNILSFDEAHERLLGFVRPVREIETVDTMMAAGRVLAEAAEAIPGFDPAIPEAVNVNGAGNFVVGGPEGDNGLSGKKLVVDAYGPRVAIGGGALCGKDFFKADRAGAILARRLTKAVVLTGAARECVATLAFLPGASKAKIVSLCGDGGQELDEARWGQLLDLSLEGLGERYALTTSLADIARWGHFTDADRPWEKISFDAG